MAFIFVENMSTGIKKNQDILRTSIVTFTVPISCRSYRSLSRNVWLLAFGKSQIRNEAGGKSKGKSGIGDDTALTLYTFIRFTKFAG